MPLRSQHQTRKCDICTHADTDAQRNDDGERETTVKIPRPINALEVEHFDDVDVHELEHVKQPEIDRREWNSIDIRNEHCDLEENYNDFAFNDYGTPRKRGNFLPEQCRGMEQNKHGQQNSSTSDCGDGRW